MNNQPKMNIDINKAEDFKCESCEHPNEVIIPIEEIKVDNDLSEYVDDDYSRSNYCDVNEGNKSFYLLLNDVFEFECELLN